MQPATEDLLRRATIFRRLSPGDRQKLTAVTTVREFEKGEAIFSVTTDGLRD